MDAARAAVCANASPRPRRVLRASKDSQARLYARPALFRARRTDLGLDALVRRRSSPPIGEEGKTVLVTSHRMDELAGLLDEVWVMAGGRIVAVHAIDALRADACIISGRLRSADAPPVVPGAISLGGEGLLRSWAALDRAVRERLIGCGVLESPSVEPLPLDRASHTCCP